MLYCHTCRQSLLRSQTLRRNLKAAGNTVLSYDVICPHCHEQIGQVLWGKYIAGPPPAEAAAVRTFAPEQKARTGNDRRKGDRRAAERRRGDRRSALPLIASLLRMPELRPRYGGPERRRETRRKDERRKGDNREQDRRTLQ